MRKFCSYGPLDVESHYYAPRRELVDFAYTRLVGEKPDRGGHYITIWAPRQRGKTWVMQQTLQRLREEGRFAAAALSLEYLKAVSDVGTAARYIVQRLGEVLGLALPTVETLEQLPDVFKRGVLPRPLILILDEFDALSEEAIGGLAAVFRNIYVSRLYESEKASGEKEYLLHGLALVGVRAVLGVENVTGSPFNVQRSVHIPNLTEAEVNEMYRWYERESGQRVEQAVIDRVFYETQGQPGLVSWLGELLTEVYHTSEPTLTLAHFDRVYAEAVNALPNNNVLNIISKARQSPYQETVLELFRTAQPMRFTYDDPHINFLYMNGVIDREGIGETEQSVKFSSPFVQKRLFNYFARTIFRDPGRLYDPFLDLSDVISDESLNVKNLLRCYEEYLQRNRDWLLKDAPRRADMRHYEAVYHFGLYAWLERFFQRRGQIWPEFPTGNGKVDLLIRYAGRLYAIEIKSFVDVFEYRESLAQAACYARQLGLEEITLAMFVEEVDDDNRARYEEVYTDAETGVVVRPTFVETGN